VTRNFTIHASCPKRSAGFPRPQIRRSDSRQWAHSSDHPLDHPLTPFGSPSIECRNMPPNSTTTSRSSGVGSDSIVLLIHIRRRRRGGKPLAVEDLHRERQEGPCFGATALGPSRWTKVQFLSSPPWKIRHSQLPQLQSKWQAYSICLCRIRSRRRHGMRRAVDVAPHGFLSYILTARTSVAFAAGNNLKELYRPSDVGVTWAGTYRREIASWSGFNAKLKSVPDHGDLFFTSGPLGNPGSSHSAATPLMRSTDGGAGWNAVPGVLEVFAFWFRSVPYRLLDDLYRRMGTQ